VRSASSLPGAPPRSRAPAGKEDGAAARIGPPRRFPQLRRPTTIQPPSARDAARGDWRAHPEAEDWPVGQPPRDDGPGAEVVYRERPATGARPRAGPLPVASQADGAEPEAPWRERSVAGPLRAAVQPDGLRAEVVWRERQATEARPRAGPLPAAAQADGAEPEALSRARPVAGPLRVAAQPDGPRVDVVWRERPVTGPRPVAGPLPAAQPGEAEPEALSRERWVAGPLRAAAQPDGPGAVVV